MILKIISSLIIIICCTLLGLHMSYRYTRRIYNIRALQNILTHLEAEVVHYSTFLSQALRNSVNMLDGEWKGFFIQVADMLEDRNEPSLADGWQECITSLQNNPYIGKAEYEIMYRFGMQLGNSNKESQEKYFQLTQEQLKIEENNAQQLRIKYDRMYRSLGLLLGLGIAIILF